jgi:hypothetical protein
MLTPVIVKTYTGQFGDGIEEMPTRFISKPEVIGSDTASRILNDTTGENLEDTVRWMIQHNQTAYEVVYANHGDDIYAMLYISI